MRIPIELSRTGIITVVSIIALLLIAWLFAWEPVTRNLVSTDAWCVHCHGERDYLPTARMSFTKSHPAEPEEGVTPARCVDCHLPKGFWAATYAYTHYLSMTDLYGHFRDREGERAGDWIPLSAARAYRVRDRLFEYDSVTCRSCHVFEDIKPKRKRGQRAHKKALKTHETCIECHDNIVHSYVELREDAFERPETGEE